MELLENGLQPQSGVIPLFLIRTVSLASSQGCARFPEFKQNFTERRILWSLCSADFHTLTLQLPIQTPHSVAPELKFLSVHWKTVQISGKRAHPSVAAALQR